MVEPSTDKSVPPTGKGRSPAQRMVTLERVGVYYLPITKCGCTYLKNLFYYLDHGSEHPLGLDIHSSADAMIRANPGDDEKIQQSSYAFAVLRDPVDRFLSLYFDKIYGDGPMNFPEIREFLATEIGINLARNLDIAAHRDNCHRLIAWLGQNLAHKTSQPVNPHWRRQFQRVKRVKNLELQHLTLEGLDWQLPLFLGDILPDISRAMAAVRTKNEAVKPFTRAEIVDETLLKEIEDVYAMDKIIYDQAVQKWQSWRSEIPETGDDKRLRCFTAGNLPINCVATSKVGRTYLRNLMYILEHGEAYHEPLKIHKKGVSSFSELTIRELASEISFFVIRHPVSRFFSLYFDKVYATGEQSFPWIAKRLAQHRGYVAGENLSIEQHRNNVLALLGYIERKFATEPISDLNPHWSPQAEIADKAVNFGLQPLLLDNLEQQILQIAGDRIEGLEAVMQAIPDRNKSEKPYTMAEIVTPEMVQQISTLYSDDLALYVRVKAGWAMNGKPPKL